MSTEVFAYCNANCRHRVLTIDQTVELIQEMAANGFQVPEGFIPTTAVNAIVEQNTGKELKLFVGTQERFDAWTGDKSSVFAIITDDPTAQDIFRRLDSLEKVVDKISDGTIPLSVKKNDGTMVQITEDANGVLNYEGKTIPHTKTLWSNPNGATSASWSEELQIGDVIEVTYKITSSITSQKCVIYQYSPNSKQGILRVREDWGNKSIGVDKFSTAEIDVYQKSASGYIINSSVSSTGDSVTLYKVVKVIE